MNGWRSRVYAAMVDLTAALYARDDGDAAVLEHLIKAQRNVGRATEALADRMATDGSAGEEDVAGDRALD